ncbi:MAG: hypothetical protein KAJ66_06525 [Candidatus Omnitrophica bacterium]|nr:hypothetical protein [Candidatus Omnitrophota bacterium]
MGVISIRLNQQEEKVLKRLSSYYDEDRSKVLKKSLMEMHETLIDRKVIEKYEAKERGKNIKKEELKAENNLFYLIPEVSGQVSLNVRSKKT